MKQPSYTELLKEAMQLHDEILLLQQWLNDRIERLSAIDDHFLTLEQRAPTEQEGGYGRKDS